MFPFHELDVPDCNSLIIMFPIDFSNMRHDVWCWDELILQRELIEKIDSSAEVTDVEILTLIWMSSNFKFQIKRELIVPAINQNFNLPLHGEGAWESNSQYPIVSFMLFHLHKSLWMEFTSCDFQHCFCLIIAIKDGTTHLFFLLNEEMAKEKRNDLKKIRESLKIMKIEFSFQPLRSSVFHQHPKLRHF